MGDEYRHTSGELARHAQVTAATVTAYAKAGLLDFIVISNGTRLFRAGQAPRVRAIYTERMASRGRRSASAGVQAA